MPFRFFTCICVSVLLYSSSALAASISVSPAGSTAYTVQGDMTGVAGIDLTIGYDSSSLTAPTVRSGGLVAGALMTSNTSVPGTIRIAIVSVTPFRGSGTIVDISFAARNGSSGLTFASAKLIDSKGASLPPVQAALVADQSTTALASSASSASPSSSSTSSVQTSTEYSSSTTGIVGLGSVSMPGDTPPKSDVKPSEPGVKIPLPEPPPLVTPPQQREVAEEKPLKPEKLVEPKQVAYASVLDRFKMHEGERTPEAMLALFDKPVAPELRQEPSIAVSDGSSRVRIYAELPKGSGSSPNFRLTGVEVVSVTSDEKTGALQLEVLPKKEVTQASVTILTESLTMTVPLTVVPPAGKNPVSKTSLADFLKDRGAKKPKFDLNSDGVHDYLDDYIYTGQYLVEKAGSGKDGKK
jgi:hypothetical protein